MNGIGIVIVTHNSAREIGACLDAAKATGADVMVVDNASEDSTREDVTRRRVRLIANTSNRGFAGAANQGFAALQRPFILLMNPDVTLQTEIGALRDACGEKGVAIASGKLLGRNGEPQIGFMVRRLPRPVFLIFESLLLNRLWPGNPVNWHYRCLGLDYAKAVDVEQPAGAFLMIRRSVWEKLRGFDEGFFPVWFEDVDFCARVLAAGYRIRYVPSVVAKHTGGHSIRKISLEIRPFYWYGSLLKYSARHFSWWSGKLVCLAVIAGSCFRVIPDIARHWSRKPIDVYGKVVRLAARELFRGRHDDFEVLSL